MKEELSGETRATEVRVRLILFTSVLHFYTKMVAYGAFDTDIVPGSEY